MGDALKFLRAGLKNPLHIGAIAPSSPALAEAMVHGIRPEHHESILELGVGTGPFTVTIDELLVNKNNYLGIEREPSFFPHLNNRFEHLRLVNGDASHAFDMCQEAGLTEVRYILSGLPFASLPSVVRESILECIDQFMAQGCMFRTFQYVHAYRLPPAVAFRKYMTERYGACERSHIVWQNLPPAYTLTWKAPHKTH
jgi:phospholipid N-methyltransferase